MTSMCARIWRRYCAVLTISSSLRRRLTLPSSLSNAPFDLLLTDIIMPGWNGRELAREAERLRPGIRVLYMTGYSRNAVVHQGRLDEGVDLLQKPVSQAQLAMRVRTALDRKV